MERDIKGKFIKGHIGYKATLGKKISDEQKKKLSKTLKEGYATGRIKIWSKGLTKENNDSIKRVSEFLRNRIVSDETRQKMREHNLKYPRRYWLGKKRPDISKMMSITQKGRKLSPELREKALLNIRPYHFKIGEQHKYWKGGTKRNKHLISEPTYKKWRDVIFKRDNYTCQDCKNANGNGNKVYLEAHHIKSWKDYPELRYIHSNGITLCRDCHKRITFNSEVENVIR